MRLSEKIERYHRIEELDYLRIKAKVLDKLVHKIENGDLIISGEYKLEFNEKELKILENLLLDKFEMYPTTIYDDKEVKDLLEKIDILIILKSEKLID